MEWPARYSGMLTVIHKVRSSSIILTMITGLAGYYGWVTGSHALVHRNTWIASPPSLMSTEAEEDRRVYFETRKMAGSSRWQRAAFEANLSDRQTVQSFLDTAQIHLTSENEKKLARYLRRAQALARTAMEREKNIWQRRRPFIDLGGKTCVFNYKRFITSWSYPSGHTVRGYTIALILGRMYPSRKQFLLNQAHEFAESRVVCGMHWASDVRGGEEFAYKLVETIEQENREE